MTSPTMKCAPAGPWRHGVATTSIAGRPGSSRSVDSHGSRPRADPPRRLAPETVVITAPADGSSARPAGSRLSPWWSCVSRTASIGPTSSAGIAGPASLRDAAPQPKAYLRPGASNVGSVSRRQPPTSMRMVGPPTCVAGRRSRPARLDRVLQRPGERVVGDLLPAARGGQQVRALELLDLGDRVGLVVPGVGLLDLRRHEVVRAAGDEQQRRTCVVGVVD